jgi:hypothetical protein
MAYPEFGDATNPDSRGSAIAVRQKRISVSRGS